MRVAKKIDKISTTNTSNTLLPLCGPFKMMIIGVIMKMCYNRKCFNKNVDNKQGKKVNFMCISNEVRECPIIMPPVLMMID